MPRRLIAFLIACYAIAFAFGAMAAIRWPSLMMAADLITQTNPAENINSINWRELGIAYGAPYFLSALCLYASAIILSNRRRGAVLWYLMGLTAGFPPIFLIDFAPGWWQNPSAGEGAIAGAAVGAILILFAVWELRCRKPRRVDATADAETVTAEIVSPPSPPKKKKRSVYQPVPPAIARQRAMFAADGQRLLAKQGRQMRR